jgi:hypothetical protein
VTSTDRTAGCGPACPVVWQGKTGDARLPYADSPRGLMRGSSREAHGKSRVPSANSPLMAEIPYREFASRMRRAIVRREQPSRCSTPQSIGPASRWHSSASHGSMRRCPSSFMGEHFGVQEHTHRQGQALRAQRPDRRCRRGVEATVILRRHLALAVDMLANAQRVRREALVLHDTVKSARRNTHPGNTARSSYKHHCVPRSSGYQNALSLSSRQGFQCLAHSLKKALAVASSLVAVVRLPPDPRRRDSSRRSGPTHCRPWSTCAHG